MSRLPYESKDLDVNVVPQSYYIQLAPRPELSTGRVEIELALNEGFSSGSIVLHADAKVGIANAKLIYHKDALSSVRHHAYEDWKRWNTFEANIVVGFLSLIKFNLLDVEVNSWMQTQRLYFMPIGGSTLPLGSATLTIWFSSPVQKESVGYGVYQVLFDKTIGYTTHFEPVGAREAFPCFDEPAIRATFQLELVIPKGTRALSNTNVESTQDAVHNSRIIFKETIKMSTYLLCFAVGPFASISRDITVTNGKDNLPLKVSAWGPPGSEKKLEQALEWGANAVSYFTRTFQCFLPLEKLDLLGVPLSGLGMENFGILSFRKTHFLIDEETTLAIRKRICLLILHEVSHLWFGDMVTIRWWKYLYLKEGFARLLEYTVASILYPEYCWWDHFLANHYGPSRLTDALPNRVHPVEVPIHRAKDSEDIFDFISYAKGASVLRMSSDMLGAEAFLAALPLLINTHKYQSIETPDLWECFRISSGSDVAAMDKWVKHNGHPIVSFDIDVIPDSDQLGVTFTQSLHQLGDATLTMDNVCCNENKEICYPIPVVELKVFPSEGEPIVINHTLYTHTKHVVLENIPGATQDAIILVNASHRGYFAVNYSALQWEQILTILDKFNPTELIGLLIEAAQAPSRSEKVLEALITHSVSLDNLDISAFIGRL